MKSERHTEPLMTIAAVAKHLGISGRTVRRLLEDRKIAFHRVGGSIRVTPADLEIYLRNTRES